jgi:hypothetical protein
VNTSKCTITALPQEQPSGQVTRGLRVIRNWRPPALSRGTEA